MNVQQISVFLENRAGRLANIAAVLKNNRINIRTLTIAETNDYGVLRMIVNKPDDTVAILKAEGFMVKQNPMIAVEIDDREGIMYDIAALCDKNDISIEYLYSFVEQVSKKAILFLRVEDTDAVAQLFINNGYKLLSSDDVCKI
jgi:hypothetical protein